MPDITEIRITSETGELTALPTTTDYIPPSLYTQESTLISPDTFLQSVDGLNLGSGENILTGVLGTLDRLFNFKTIKAGPGISLTSSNEELTIIASNSLSVDLSNATGILPISKGGTGTSTNVTNGILIGMGTSTSYINPPTKNSILSWDTSSNTYNWITPPSSPTNTTSITLSSSYTPLKAILDTTTNNYDLSLQPNLINVNDFSSSLIVSKGGTGKSTFLNNTILLGNGTSGIAELASTQGFLYFDGITHKWISESGTVSSVGITSSNSDLTITNSPITTSGNIDIKLSDTGVVPGSYTNANITVDFKGRISQISNGSSSGGSVSATNLGLQGEGWYAGTTNGVLSFKRFDVENELSISSLPSSIIIGINNVPVNKGGTGLSILGQPGQSLRINADRTAYEFYTPTNAGGSVSSVGITPKSNKIEVSNSPITSVGNISLDIVESNLSINNIGGVLTPSKGGTGLSNVPNGIIIGVNNTYSSIPAPTGPSQLTYNGTSYVWGSANNSAIPSNTVLTFNFTVNYNQGALSPTSVSDLPTGWTATISGQDIIITHTVAQSPIFITMMGLDTASVPNQFKLMYPTSTNPMIIPESSNGSKEPSITQFKFRATTSATGATTGVSASLAKIKITF